jgi:hypothetical protein
MRIKLLISFLILVMIASCSQAPLAGQTNSSLSSQQTETSTVTPTLEATRTSQQVTTAPANTSTTLPATATPASSATASLPTAVTPSATAAFSQTPGQPSGQGLLVDRHSLALFEGLPDSAIASAAQIRLLFRHASIGTNIDQGLNCLANNFADRRPNACGAYFDPKYDRSQWVFQFRGNPGWINKVDDFVTHTNANSNDYDAFTFTLGYVDGLDGSTYPEISNPENFQTLYIDKLEALEAAHPDKTFIWWTMSLARLDNANTQRFNDMLREYARANNKILLDIADIESHDPQGVPERSARGYEIIDENYTNESRAGHLNETGRDRLSRAFWVLMAQVSGWQP